MKIICSFDAYRVLYSCRIFIQKVLINTHIFQRVYNNYVGIYLVNRKHGISKWLLGNINFYNSIEG